MLCAFIGAGAGNFLRAALIKRHYTLYMCTILSVALGCLAYIAALRLGEMFSTSPAGMKRDISAHAVYHPGFPFITSGIDLAKLDMRSGLERLAYAVIIVVNATITAWVMAMILGLKPNDFPDLALSP